MIDASHLGLNTDFIIHGGVGLLGAVLLPLSPLGKCRLHAEKQ